MNDDPWLTICGVDPPLWAYPIRRKWQTLGRAKDCDIRLDHFSVSRHHAELRSDGSLLMIRDLGSRNGTYINDVAINDGSFKLGDSLKVGSVSLDAVSAERIMNWRRNSDDSTQNRSDDTPLRLWRGKLALSSMQLQVLYLLLRGHTEKQVAATLRISYHTVHTHVKRIYHAFGVRSRAELMLHCLSPVAT